MMMKTWIYAWIMKEFIALLFSNEVENTNFNRILCVFYLQFSHFHTNFYY